MAITAAELQVSVESRGVKQAARDVDDLGSSVDKAGATMGRASGVAGTFAKALGAVALAGGVGIAAGLAGSIKVAADFQQSLANVGAATGATAEQMKAMRAEALKIGADTSKGAGEAVEAMGELTKSGVSVADVLGGVGRTVVQMSEASGSSVANMATLMSDTLNVFKVGAQDSSAAANTLVKAAGASSISIDDMAQSLSAGGLVAKSAGMSVDDFATAIGIMGNQGLKGSDAGTSLKAAIAGLTPTSKAAKAAFQDLGIEVFDAEGKFKAFPEILASLSTSFSGLTEEQRATTAELLFGSDGIRAFNALVPDTSKGLADATTQWGAFGTAMAGAPSIAEQSAARLKTFQGAIEMLKGTLETIAIQVGSVFLPVLAQMTGWIGTNLPAAFAAAQAAIIPVKAALLEGWEMIQPRVEAAGAAILAAFQAVLVWFQSNWPTIRAELLEVWDFIAPKVQAVASIITSVLGAAFTALRPLIEPVLSFIVDHLGEIIIVAGTVAGAFAAFTVIAGIVGSVAGAVASLGAAMGVAGGAVPLLVAALGGPLTIALAAIALAVGALVLAWTQNWGDIQGKTHAVIAEITTSLRNFEAFMDQWQVGPKFEAAFDAIVNADIAAKVRESDLGGKLIAAVGTEIDELRDANLGPKFAAAFDFIHDADIAAKVHDANLGGKLKDAISDAFDDLRDANLGTEIILPAIDDMLASIKDANVGGAIKDANIGGKLKDDLAAEFDQLKDADLGPKIVAALESAFQAARDADLRTDIAGIVGREFDELKDADLGSKLVGAVRGAYDALIDANLGGRLKAMFKGDNAEMEADAVSAWERIKGALSAAWESIKSAASSAWEGVKGAFRDGIGDIVSQASGIGGQVKGAVGDLGDVLVAAGRQVMAGLASGIRDGAESTVRAALGWVTSKIPEWKPIQTDDRLLRPAAQIMLGGMAEEIVVAAQQRLRPALAGLSTLIQDAAAGWSAVVTEAAPFASLWAQTTAALGDQAAQIRRMTQDMAPWIEALRLEKLALLDTTPFTAEYAAREASIKILTAEIAKRKERIALVKDELVAFKEVQTALDGFNEAMSAMTEGGKFQTPIMASLQKAIAGDDPAAGASLFTSIQKMIDEATKRAVPLAAEMGQTILDAAAAALASPSPENIQAVLAATGELFRAVEQAGEEAKARAALTGANVGRAVADALADQALRDAVGAAGAALFAAWDAAVAKPSEAANEKIGQSVAAIQATLRTLPEFLQGELGAQLAGAWDAFVANMGDEASTAQLQTTLASVQTAIQAFPRALDEAAPLVREAAMRLWEQVTSGAITPEQMRERVAAITSALPKGLEEAHPVVQAAAARLMEAIEQGANPEKVRAAFNEVSKAVTSVIDAIEFASPALQAAGQQAIQALADGADPALVLRSFGAIEKGITGIEQVIKSAGPALQAAGAQAIQAIADGADPAVVLARFQEVGRAVTSIEGIIATATPAVAAQGRAYMQAILDGADPEQAAAAYGRVASAMGDSFDFLPARLQAVVAQLAPIVANGGNQAIQAARFLQGVPDLIGDAFTILPPVIASVMADINERIANGTLSAEHGLKKLTEAMKAAKQEAQNLADFANGYARYKAQTTGGGGGGGGAGGGGNYGGAIQEPDGSISIPAGGMSTDAAFASLAGRSGPMEGGAGLPPTWQLEQLRRFEEEGKAFAKSALVYGAQAAAVTAGAVSALSSVATLPASAPVPAPIQAPSVQPASASVSASAAPLIDYSRLEDAVARGVERGIRAAPAQKDGQPIVVQIDGRTIASSLDRAAGGEY